jgi:hypothetical protein
MTPVAATPSCIALTGEAARDVVCAKAKAGSKAAALKRLQQQAYLF